MSRYQFTVDGIRSEKLLCLKSWNYFDTHFEKPLLLKLHYSGVIYNSFFPPYDKLVFYRIHIPPRITNRISLLGTHKTLITETEQRIWKNQTLWDQVIPRKGGTVQRRDLIFFVVWTLKWRTANTYFGGKFNLIKYMSTKGKTRLTVL